jgi:DNA polymerase/3'-5' exonuclease PolX
MTDRDKKLREMKAEHVAKVAQIRGFGDLTEEAKSRRIREEEQRFAREYDAEYASLTGALDGELDAAYRRAYGPVQGLQGRALTILDKAETAGDLRTALGAIREARGNLELLAKLLGELDERPVVNLNVSPEWLELRAVIVGALEPHSEALSTVVGALEGAGSG